MLLHSSPPVIFDKARHYTRRWVVYLKLYMAMYKVCGGFWVDKSEPRVPQMYSYNTSLGETLTDLAALSSMGEPTVVLSSMELSKYTIKLASLTQDNLFKRGIDISWAEAEHYVKVNACTYVWILCMAEVCKDHFSIHKIFTRIIFMCFDTDIWINNPNFSPFSVIGNHTILHDRWNTHQAHQTWMEHKIKIFRLQTCLS